MIKALIAKLKASLVILEDDTDANDLAQAQAKAAKAAADGTAGAQADAIVTVLADSAALVDALNQPPTIARR